MNGTITNGNALDAPKSDPAIYNAYHAKFQSLGLPKDSTGWIHRAQEVARILSEDAAQRDIENKSPFAEVALLKSAGLVKLLGPTAFGGGGQSWETAYRVIREIAKGDGSIGMILGYHLVWSTTANVRGTNEQKDRFQQLIMRNNYFVGGAVNPRDNDSRITSGGDYIVFNGFKHFNTGGVVSDLTILEGVLDGTDQHMFVFVQTNQPGITFLHNWNNIGLRLTESGSVRITNVKVPWADALGWDTSTKTPIASIGKIPYPTIFLPTIQLVFCNFYIGITQGALGFAARYTTSTTRAWPYGGDNKDKATDEFYILEGFGNFSAHLHAVEALADRTGKELAELYANHSEKRDLTARQRGEIAESVAAVKVVATDVGLRVTNGIFELTGARATGKKVGMDRFWRDIRTHTLHDPVAYKNRELGRFELLNEIPEPTWYT